MCWLITFSEKGAIISKQEKHNGVSFPVTSSFHSALCINCSFFFFLCLFSLGNVHIDVLNILLFPGPAVKYPLLCISAIDPLLAAGRDGSLLRGFYFCFFPSPLMNLFSQMLPKVPTDNSFRQRTAAWVLTHRSFSFGHQGPFYSTPGDVVSGQRHGSNCLGGDHILIC